MRVLVTGSSGVVGRWTVPHLEQAGHDVQPFDAADGNDVQDLDGLRRSVEGCDAVVHLAAVLGWHDETDAEFQHVNALGTWNALTAAVGARVRRFVFVSSIDVLGVFKGHRPPDYLPLDDDHPLYPNTPYALSKHVGEVLCADVRRTDGLETVILRPPGVWEPDTYGWIAEQRRIRPSFEFEPFWEYGAFLDVRDLAAAIERAVVGPDPGGEPFGLAADETNTSGPTSRAWATRLHPAVPWRGGRAFDEDPRRTLLANARAKDTLDWQPAHGWRQSG